MIGIQSHANQCQSNGLRMRDPYEVGGSIMMWNATPIIEIATSIGNGASGDSSFHRRLKRCPAQTSAAVASPRPTMPSGPCVGPRCHLR